MGFDKLHALLSAHFTATRDDPSKWDQGGAWFMDSVPTAESLMVDYANTADDNAAATQAREAGDTGGLIAARGRLNWTASVRRDLRRQFFGSDNRLRRPSDGYRLACLRSGYIVLVLQRMKHILTALRQGGR